MHPNLPEHDVEVCAVSAQAAVLQKQLHSLNILTLPIPPHPCLSADVASHADMNLLQLSERDILLLPGLEKQRETLQSMGFRAQCIKEEIFPEYPANAALNAACISNVLFCNPKSVAPEVLVLAAELSLTIVRVKQGYTKCSVCMVTPQAFLTDDAGIARAGEANGFSVLLLSKGSVRLEGQPYGFIGGSCGLIRKKTLLANGDLSGHADSSVIFPFLEQHGVQPFYSREYPLTDIGGILPLVQKATKPQHSSHP